MAKKWIQDAHLHKGKLHRELGIPEGKIIPESLLIEIENEPVGSHIFTEFGNAVEITPKLKREANLADTFKHFHRHR